MHPETPFDNRPPREAESETTAPRPAAAHDERIALFDHATNEWQWLEF